MKTWKEPKLSMLAVAKTHTNLETSIFDDTPRFDDAPRFDERPTFTTESVIQVTTGSSIIIDEMFGVSTLEFQAES